MEDFIFWQHWEAIKCVFDGMQEALIKAKGKNPERDYSEADAKLKMMCDLQIYLGTMQERVRVIKQLNYEVNGKLFELKQAHAALIQERNALKKENEELKKNITEI